MSNSRPNGENSPNPVTLQGRYGADLQPFHFFLQCRFELGHDLELDPGLCSAAPVLKAVLALQVAE
jgi:hypothetical protein